MEPDSFALNFPEETEYVEFKQGISADQIQDVAVAFSNHAGGVILLGVAPTGDVTGIAPSSTAKDRILGALGQARSLGRHWIHELRIGERTVLVIAIARRTDGAAQTRDGRVLVRRGTEKVPLFGDELLAFLNSRSLGSYETTTTSATISDADEHALGALVEAFRWSDDILNRLTERRLLSSDGEHLTVAGALLLLPDPTQHLGKAMIELRRVGAGGQSELRLEIRGPLPVQIDRTVAEISRELGVDSVIVGTRRRELPRVPQRALREAVANAVAHRSYEASGTAIVIEITRSELRITSPGPLPEPVTVENIRDTQAARNPSVIDVLRRLHLAEDEGAGVDRIIDDMRAELLGDPIFEDTGSHVTVRLSTRSAVSIEERIWLHDLQTSGDMDASDRLLLVHALRGERLTNGGVRALFACTETEARTRLQRLESLGLLLRSGQRGTTTYVSGPSIQTPSWATEVEVRSQVLGLAERLGAISNATVRQALRVERTEALRILSSLVRDGLLVRVGEKRGIRYVLP